MTSKRKLITIIGLIAAVVILGGTAAIVLLTRHEKSSNELDPPNPAEPPAPSNSILGRYTKVAISCDAPKCADIGRKVLEENGTVADAAIATLLCMGVFHSQSMGIGGGFLMVYYNKKESKTYVLNARERAPGKATENMFEGNATLSATGGLAVAVPGEMKGYWELYKRFGGGSQEGGLPWKRLLEPTIELCEKGIEVSRHTANAFGKQRANLFVAPSMKAIFVDPKTGDFYKEGQNFTRPVLAETLQKIAEDSVNGGDLLYKNNSDLAKWLIEDLKDLGGIMTIEDLVNYNATWDEPVNVTVNGGFTIHSVPPPGSGVLMAFILRILNKYQFSPKSINGSAKDVKIYHLIIEAFKHTYAKRTLLGDPFDLDIKDGVDELVHNMTLSQGFLDEIHEKIKLDSTSNNWEDYGTELYQKNDHGTSHLSIIGGNGDAISVTSSVNLYFGARIRSNRTGIIYNDQMDDFSAPNITNSFGVPPSPYNFIKPGKRPLSSMCPTIITDSAGNVRLVVGTAGGTRIPTATAYVSIRNLWFNETIKDAIDSRRLHHQLAPMQVEYEYEFTGPMVQGLEKIGHKMVRSMPLSSITMGVARSVNGSLWANCDYRKPCSIAGY